MRVVTIDPKHAPHQRQHLGMLGRRARVVLKSDRERVEADLCHARDYRPVRAAERVDILTLGRQHIHDVCRQTSEHTDSEVESVRRRHP